MAPDDDGRERKMDVQHRWRDHGKQLPETLHTNAWYCKDRGELLRLWLSTICVEVHWSRLRAPFYGRCWFMPRACMYDHNLNTLINFIGLNMVCEPKVACWSSCLP